MSNAELVYKNYEGKEPKDVWTSFDIFETNSIDMSKLGNLIFQKSKGFYILEKRRCSNIKCLGLIYTEEESISGWIHRNKQVIKMKMSSN